MNDLLRKIGPWIDQAIYAGITVYALFHWQWSAHYLVGISLTFVGFTLWTIAKLQLGASFAVWAQAKRLVTTGLYSKIRHPIYFFGGIAILGLFVAWGRLVPLVLFLAFYTTQLLRMKKEEAVLEQAFGDEYRRYKASTWF